MKKRKLLSLLLALALMLSMLAGCASGSSSSGSSSGGESASETDADTADSGDAADTEASAVSGDKIITVNCNDGDPGTLDPFAASSSARSVCLMEIYDKLLEYDADGNLVGVLVKNWSQEGRVVSLELYDNIYDTDGNHFTASDVVYSIQKAAEGGNTSALIFDAMEAVDDYNVELTVNSDVVTTFENNVTGLYMVTQAAYEASGENMSMKPVATGSYKVDNYETGATLTLVKNEDYWQSADQRPALIQQQNADTIVYNLMTESSQVIVGLESGEIDAGMCDFNLVSRFKEGGESSDKGLEIKVISTWGGNAFFFNESDNSYFKDNIALRKAILYSIDRQGIVDSVFDGYAENPVCYGQLRYPDANPEWANQDYYNYNPELAAEYFAESGYSAGELTLRLIYPTSSYCDNMADLIQAYLGVLGINVEINSLEAAIYSEYMLDSTQWDIAFLGKGGGGSITRIWNATLNRTTYSSDGSFCAGFISDDTLQSLLEAASNVETNSIETVDAVQQYLNEQAYNMQLYVEDKCIVYNSNKIVDICTNADARWVPGASTFVWN